MVQVNWLLCFQCGESQPQQRTQLDPRLKRIDVETFIEIFADKLLNQSKDANGR